MVNRTATKRSILVLDVRQIRHFRPHIRHDWRPMYFWAFMDDLEEVFIFLSQLAIPKLPPMSHQEPMSGPDPHAANSDGHPSLVAVTSQLVSPSANPLGSKPQVVFVGEEEPDQKAVEAPKTPDNQQSEVRSHIVPLLPTPAAEEEPKPEAKFAVNPFDLEIDGPVPVMAKLPIINAKAMTEKVVSREKAGEHYAWRLMPGPYPDLGNMPQFKSEEAKPIPAESTPAESTPAEPANKNSKSSSVRLELPVVARAPVASAAENVSEPETWDETEVVAEEAELDDHGDSFFAQSGDVISIDGNQGYDHIDLRSYSMDDATFQPGAILLNPSEESDAEDREEPLAPITIQHRGVGFAIFKGEVRVEL